jgi:hypothetical protein
VTKPVLPAALVCGAALAALLACALGAAETPGADEWKYDVVYRKNGPTLRGLVLEQTPGCVRLKCITRKIGSPTVVFSVELPREEVVRVELLPEADRERLRQKLDALQQERQLLSELRSRDPSSRDGPRSGDTLDLKKVPWVGDSRVEGLSFQSAHFRLVSNAQPKVVELAAFHLEQIYAAYARCLPPRTTGSATTILLPQSKADYQALLRGQGRNLANPAFYDADKNQIVCLCELQRLNDEKERAHQYHAKLAAQLDGLEKDLQKAYRGAIPPEVRAPLEEARQKIKLTEASNLHACARAQRDLFRRLYHEAFHAYLANFVYPAREAAVPRWLNEGLAQIFESAIVEAGELRIGHADRARRDAVQRAIKEGTLPSLADVLRSGPRQFLVVHDGDARSSDRYYLASWALAFHLTFERKVLGTRALDDYVHALHRGRDPLDAFGALVGEPLPQFEKDFQSYLLHLRPDGSVPK